MSDPPGPVGIDGARFRHVLGHYPTGVAVVAAISPAGRPVALTVGSFTSVSLDPPLVGFAPGRDSTSWPLVRSAGSFCVNVLAEDQEDVCRIFARSGGDKFGSVDWHPGKAGAPVLENTLASIDCVLEFEHEAGDHTIVVARVTQLEIRRQVGPLLFFKGGYGRFTQGGGEARVDSDRPGRSRS